MYYFYLLKSEKTGNAYYGHTNNLKKRFYQHNNGENQTTKYGIPWKLVYYEAYLSKDLAKQREYRVKAHGKGLFDIKKRASFDDA